MIILLTVGLMLVLLASDQANAKSEMQHYMLEFIGD